MPPADSEALSEIIAAAIGARAMPADVDDSTALLGAIPELDSMALLAILTQIESRFGLRIDDEAIDASIFTTFGALRAFVQAQRNAA